MLRYKVGTICLLWSILVSCQPAKPPFECKDALGCVTIMPNQPLKIGTLQVLSGGSANLGEFSLQAIQLAAKQRNNQILGHNLELQKEDESCTPEGGANGALKIVADPQVVGIVGTVCSSSAINAAQIMSKAGLVMISGANVVPNLTGVGEQKGANWQAGYFRTVQNAAYWGDTAAIFAFEKLGVRKAATIHDNDAYAQVLTELFAKKFTELGGEVVLATSINRGDEDMKPVLTSVEQAGVDFLFYPIFQAEAAQITLQSQQLAGLENTSRMIAGSAATEGFIKTIGQTGQGLYVVLAAKPSGVAFDTFTADFKAEYNSHVPHFTVPYVYDAASLLFKAIEQVAIKDDDGTLHIGRQALRDTLYSMKDFQGASGGIRCNQWGDCNTGAVSVLQLADPAAGLEGLNGNVVFSLATDFGK